jgi:hypothetical protein
MLELEVVVVVVVVIVEVTGVNGISQSTGKKFVAQLAKALITEPSVLKKSHPNGIGRPS